jgi:tRNA dimethylallyltransferase
VPHHLIDLVDPSDDHTVADFQREYRNVVSELSRRGRCGILVGGTGLYHRAVIDELDLPGEWPDIRARLVAEADQLGTKLLHARLAAVDPEAAAKMEEDNTRRVVRALEVWEGSGRRFSSYGPGLDAYPPSAIAQFGLRWDREVLASRIRRRVESMMERGLLDEVVRLRERGLSRTAAQALGYKELLAYLDGELALDAAVELIAQRTRQFAVRQLRWFQRDPRVRWIDIEHDPVTEAAPAVAAAFSA